MPAEPLYDTIGHGYAERRHPDRRIAARITAALGNARSVLNVGAGAGSYEPGDRMVVAVEPSSTMIGQRAGRAAPVVRARAEELPFGGASFDAVTALLTLHHWADRTVGLAECARVARRRVVLLTWDPWAPASEMFWLVQDYFPELLAAGRKRFPRLEEYRGVFAGAVDLIIEPLPIPSDCTDGFIGAFWARPAAYLDPPTRAGMSPFAGFDVDAGLTRLRADLDSGEWRARHGHVSDADSLDLGYRLVIAHLSDADAT